LPRFMGARRDNSSGSSLLDGHVPDTQASPEALLIHAMMLVCFSDGAMQPEELAALEFYSNTLPCFKNRSFLSAYAEATKLAAGCSGFEASVDVLKAVAAQPALARTAYVCCVELALVSKGVATAEENTLGVLQKLFGIDDVEAAQIKQVLVLKYDDVVGTPSAASAAGYATPEMLFASGGPQEVTEQLSRDREDNPWITLGLMNDITGGELMNSWKDLLDLQTRLFGPFEVEWLRANGFAIGKGVLEVGSAIGAYGSWLARSFPEMRLLGIEANPHFVKGLPDLPENYSVDACVLGQDPLPPRVAGAFDQCFVRYVLQHVSHPRRVLRSIHEALPPGGRLYIVEEDDAFMTSEPASEPFELAFDRWRKVCQLGGTDSRIGRKLAGMLSETGFRVDSYEVTLRTNAELGEDFLDFYLNALRLFHLTRPIDVDAHCMERATRMFEDIKTTHRRTTVATYPHVLVSATRAASQ
jgi:SAM-dependent methyltransferase